MEGISAEQNRTSWSIDIEVPLAASKETAASQAPVSAPAYSVEQVSRLNKDEEFSQLLYIAQKF